MNLSNILHDFGLERRRRLLGLLKPDPHALVLWSRALDSMANVAERERLEFGLDFAKAIQYRHVGLASNIYFSHPLRVAGLAILLSSAEESEAGVVAILHNVLEVSEVSFDELTAAFGFAISSQISALTVDREVQWDKAYKLSYYNQLMDGPLAARIVKIVDKLDNLFLLGLNPDESVRSRYLAEIEEFVIPLAVTSLPAVTLYMQALVNDCREIGLIEMPVAIDEGSHES